MIKQNDIIELEIEKLTYEGAALGRYFCDDCPSGFVVFVKEAAPKDRLKVKITKLNKTYAKGEIVEIIEPSKHRIKPFCPLFRACGGCCYQYLEYDYLLEQKNNMLKEAFLKSDFQPEFLEPIKSPELMGYRHKIQYRVSQTKNSKRLLIGYYKEKSHDITNIKYCPIQPAQADKMAQFVRNNWSFGAYREKNHKGLLKSFAARFSNDLKSALLTFVLNVSSADYSKIEPDLTTFFETMGKNFPFIKSISVNFNPDKTNKILSDDFKNVWGEDFIYETLEDENCKRVYKISPASFFQVNPKCAVEIFNEVKKNIGENSSILDAYGGVGAIGIWLCDKAGKIYLVEESKSAIDDAKVNFKLNNCKNYEVFLGDAKEQFKKFLKDRKKFGALIIDPPRKGSSAEALEALSKLSDKIIYVSCNPQTLVRDVKYLQTLGFRAKTTRAFDMFPYSYHIESVTVIERE